MFLWLINDNLIRLALGLLSWGLAASALLRTGRDSGWHPGWRCCLSDLCCAAALWIHLPWLNYEANVREDFAAMIDTARGYYLLYTILVIVTLVLNLAVWLRWKRRK
ncbi:MAG: hypothetical protein ACI3VN_05275 [Candidatus Onthomonas sp.]